MRGGSGGAGVDEVELAEVGDDVFVAGFVEKLSDSITAGGAVVECPLVDVHADELVGKVGFHIAGIVQGELDGGFTMFECVVDRIEKDATDGRRFAGFNEVAANGVATEWERKFSRLSPPFAQVDNAFELVVLIGDLAFVNDKACIKFVRDNALDDLVEHDVGGGEIVFGEIVFSEE